MEQLVRSVYFSDDTVRRSMHYHDCHQVIFIEKGEVLINLEGEDCRAGAGDIIMFSRYENHSLRILSKEYERFVLRINSAFGEHPSSIYSLLSNRPHGFRNIIHLSEQKSDFAHLFRRIEREFRLHDKLSEEMLELHVKELLILLYRHIPTDYMDEESFEIVYRLQRRFENHYEKPYRLADLAKEYGISVSSLSHQFKKITGMSVMGYVLACRLAAAKNALTMTNLPVSEVIERCGFGDSSNFSRVFRKHTGMSPSQFRKQYKLQQ